VRGEKNLENLNEKTKAAERKTTDIGILLSEEGRETESTLGGLKLCSDGEGRGDGANFKAEDNGWKKKRFFHA